MFSEISEWPQVINNNNLLDCNLLFSYEFVKETRVHKENHRPAASH
jgi:hypothetical protein